MDGQDAVPVGHRLDGLLEVSLDLAVLVDGLLVRRRLEIGPSTSATSTAKSSTVKSTLRRLDRILVGHLLVLA